MEVHRMFLSLFRFPLQFFGEPALLTGGTNLPCSLGKSNESRDHPNLAWTCGVRGQVQSRNPDLGPMIKNLRRRNREEEAPENREPTVIR